MAPDAVREDGTSIEAPPPAPLPDPWRIETPDCHSAPALQPGINPRQIQAALTASLLGCAHPTRTASLFSLEVDTPTGFAINAGEFAVLSVLDANCRPIRALQCLRSEPFADVGVSLLEPGAYRLYVASNVDITATFSEGPLCFDDRHAGAGHTLQNAPLLPATNTRVDGTWAESSKTAMRICPDVDDVYRVPHFGGPLHITADGAPVGISLYHPGGAPVDPAEAGTSLTPGTYGVRVQATGTSEADIGPYALTVTHGCTPDGWDALGPDDENHPSGRAELGAGATDRLTRHLCPTESDDVWLDDLVGEIQGFALEAAEVVLAPHMVNLAVTRDGADVPFTVTQTARGLDVQLGTQQTGALRLTMSNPDSTVGYTVTARPIRGMTNLPQLVDCPAQSTHTLAMDQSQTWLGDTTQTTDSVLGPCGYENLAVQASKPGTADAAAVFTVMERGDLVVDFRMAGGFLGQVYLAPRAGVVSGCDMVREAPLSRLSNTAGTDCTLATEGTLRYEGVEPGDYVLYVDGSYAPASDGQPEVWNAGRVRVDVRLEPTGALPQECQMATTVDVSGLGPAVFSYDSATDSNTFGSARHPCTPYGEGSDRLFTFVAPADGRMAVEATGRDTIVSVYADDCLSGPLSACNDDVNLATGQTWSQASWDVQADRRYFVIVDAYDAAPEASIDVRFIW